MSSSTIDIYLSHNTLYMNRATWEKSYLKLRRGRKLRERRLRLFGFAPNSRILELGCGDGLNLQIMRALGYTNIYGLDSSPELLSYIPKDIPRIAADVCNTAIASNSFDIIFIDSVLHHLYNPQTCIKEIRRILKPNGCLCILEPRNSFFRKLFDKLTFSYLSFFIPFLRDRAVTLKEEFELYSHWLKIAPNLKDYLSRQSFKIIFWKTWLIGMGIKCELTK